MPSASSHVNQVVVNVKTTKVSSSVRTNNVSAIAMARGANGSNGADGTPGTDGIGIPAGGTAGQVLSKIDGTDYNTQWDDTIQLSNDLSGTKLSPVVQSAYNPNSQVQPNSIDTLITSFQSGNGFAVISANGSQAADTVNYVKGDRSLKISTNGLGNPTSTQRSSISPTIDLTNKNIRIRVMADKPTNISEFFVYFSSDNVVANWFTVKPSDYIQVLKPNVWTTLTFSQGRNSQVTGAPNVAAINSIAVRVKDDATTSVNLWINEISYFDQPSSGIVTFTFDDNKITQYTVAKPTLDKYDYPATVYTIPSRVGTATYMTLDQLKTVQDNGWDVSNHTMNHPYLTALTNTQIEAEFYQSKKWFLDNGFTKGINDMALPHGDYNDTVVLPIARRFFRSVRTINSQVETYPVGDPYRMRTFYIVNTTTLAAAKLAVDKAIAAKEWLVFVFHSIENPATAPESWLPSDFTSLVDYVFASNAKVKTVSDVYNNGLPSTSSGGLGTVTSVSVTTANGVSGSVANATTTPAISLSLGAITPSSVTASGTVTGSNISGMNTGDQTITLTGDVTGSGAGSFATTYNNTVPTTKGGTGLVSFTAGNFLTATSSSALATSKTAPAGAVVGTSDSQTITNKNLNSGTNTFPTFNQNTTGQAGTVATIAGLISAGTNVTVTGAGTIASPYVIASTGGGGGGSGIVRSINLITTATGGASAATTDYVYYWTGSTAYTYTQPTAVSNTNRYTLINRSTVDQTVVGTAGQAFNGNASMIISPNSVRELLSDNTNWMVL